MKVYISGKIGEEVISDETRAKFAAAAKMIRLRMLSVFNPTTPEWEGTLKHEKELVDRILGEGKISFYEYCLLKDIEKISRCDAIYMLADWTESPGARAEYAFARAVGKQFFFEDRFQACEYLCKEMWALMKKGQPARRIYGKRQHQRCRDSLREETPRQGMAPHLERIGKSVPSSQVKSAYLCR